jgi:magnesium transporter
VSSGARVTRVSAIIGDVQNDQTLPAKAATSNGSAAKGVARLLNVRRISAEGLTWVDITDPTEDARKYLTDNYSFHPLDIEDCFGSSQLSKIDEYQNYIFALLHFPSYQAKKGKGVNLQWSAFVGDGFLVTLHPAELAGPSEVMRECETGEENKKANLGNGSGYLLYLILDRVVDSYFPVLDEILGMMQDLEESVFDEEVEAAKDISRLRQEILTQRRVVFPLRRLLAELEPKLSRFARMDMSVYYGDLMDHMNKICDTIAESRDTIEVFKDADFVLAGYRANNLIRSIAMMMAIGLPFLVMGSVFVILPASVDKRSVSAFVVLLAAALVSVAISLSVLRSKRLI